MTWTRRTFLATGGAAAAGALLSGRLAHALTPHDLATARAILRDRVPPGSADLKALAARALDVVRSAGATYAEVQFRTRHSETWHIGAEDWYPGKPFFGPDFGIAAGIGVRVLYNGYWGFAGRDGIATADEMAAVGRAAMEQAKMAATGKPRETQLASRPVVSDGHWTTPIEVDPFTVSDAEKIDVLMAMRDDIHHVRFESLFDIQMDAQFIKDERTLATMDGSFIGQTQYVTSGKYGVRVRKHLVTRYTGRRNDPFMGPTGAGWEYLLNYPYRDRLPEMTEEALRLRVSEPMDVGRYDVVFDAATIASMIKGTLAPATEADRAMGYLANGAGTSFLTDPLDMLGTYQVASPLVTLTTNRSMKGGCATVGWDDEGVVPVDATLVQKGLVTDFQTTREAASWFAPYYQKRNLPIRSNGCAGTSNPIEPLTQTSPNFAVDPGKQDADFLDLVRTLKKGVAVVSGEVRPDFQGLTGLGNGVLCYDVKDGVLGTQLAGGSWNFRTPEFWKNVTTIGGPKSVKSFGFESSRGANYFTVSAVPMFVRNLAFLTKDHGA